MIGPTAQPPVSSPPILPRTLHLTDSTEESGEALKTGIKALLSEGVDVAGIMHSEVGATLPALDLLEEYWSGPVAVYPNSGRYKRPR